MLATRWISPLVRRNTKSLTKRSYATASFERLDLGDWYHKCVTAHAISGCAVGAIGLPWGHADNLYTKAKRTGEPVDTGDVFVGGLLLTPIGMFFGAGIGVIIGLASPVAYPIAGVMWWMYRNKQ